MNKKVKKHLMKYNTITPLNHVNLKNKIKEYEVLKNNFDMFKLKIAAEKKKSYFPILKNTIEGEPSTPGNPSTAGEPTTAEEYDPSEFGTNIIHQINYF